METRVGAMDVAENGVMMHPHDEDSEEASHQSEIAGPELQQGFAERGGCCTGRGDGRDFEFENEQGDGNGEDTVAEGFEAAGFFFALGIDLRLHGKSAQSWITGYQRRGGNRSDRERSCRVAGLFGLGNLKVAAT